MIDNIVQEMIAQEIRAYLDAELERALLGGWPAGYEPGRGFSGTLTIDHLIQPRTLYPVVDIKCLVGS